MSWGPREEVSIDSDSDSDSDPATSHPLWAAEPGRYRPSQLPQGAEPSGLSLFHLAAKTSEGLRKELMADALSDDDLLGSRSRLSLRSRPSSASLPTISELPRGRTRATPAPHATITRAQTLRAFFSPRSFSPRSYSPRSSSPTYTSPHTSPRSHSPNVASPRGASPHESFSQPPSSQPPTLRSSFSSRQPYPRQSAWSRQALSHFSTTSLARAASSLLALERGLSAVSVSDPPSKLPYVSQVHWRAKHAHIRLLNVASRGAPGANGLFPMYAGRRNMAAKLGTRVELHSHLEGCVRAHTIWEMMKAKNFPLPGDGSLEAVRREILAKSPMDVSVHYGQAIPFYMQAFANDFDAIERVAYEFCEDKVEQGVLYLEARYVPHRMMCWKLSSGKNFMELCEIVSAVNRGFRSAEETLGITVRTILVVIVGTGIAGDVISLCQQFQNNGVVGIDLMLSYEDFSGNDIFMRKVEEVPLTMEEMSAFSTAYLENIHRTVHAGHSGSAYMVQRAVDKYHAERVGHGYEVLKLPSLYEKLRERNVHFECCPWESLISSAVDASTSNHPIAQFAADEVNFSLSTSHSTITGVNLQDEYDLASSWGLTEAHLVRSNINALRSSFLPKGEKKILMQELLENIGIRKRSSRASLL